MGDILAPVGGEEQLLAAVRCGANAVYLGTQGFNARRNAANFDGESLPGVVNYCHERDTKVYVTVNTLVTDEELPALEGSAETIARAGVDGVILQDYAALRLFRDRWPALSRIASTQTAVHNTDGARRLADMGFDCVVLARELTLDEMAKIMAAVPVRTEAFVHGAHCMSVSGACYLSAMLGGRSGNRGLCAQPCRLDWRCGAKDHALSLKDMSLLSRLREMDALGIDAFKIEGRMKRPEYVAAAVTACRKALAGEPYDEQTLRAVFSRSGFTDGYITGRRDEDMFGYRTKEDVTGGETVFKTLRQLYHKEMPRVALDLHFTADTAGSRLTISDGLHTVSADGPVPEAALHRELTPETAENALSKFGGTPYYAQSFQAEISPGLLLTAAALNGLRRETLDILSALRARGIVYEERERLPEEVSTQKSGRKIRTVPPALWVRYADRSQLDEKNVPERILLPLDQIQRSDIERFGACLTAELPAVLFPTDEDGTEKKLRSLQEQGLSSVMTENIYGLELGRRLGLTVYGGFGLNLMNTEALREAEAQGIAAVTLSPELQLNKLRDLGTEIPRGIFAYGRQPLMRWRNCPLRASKGCAACGGSGTLTDRKGIEFPVECGSKKYSSLLNSIPLHIADKDLSGFDFLLLYFTKESRTECARILEDYRQHRSASAPRTTGLYFRALA